ncbi:MAG: NADH-quinone oxidoreductase subunit A [Pirellulales bacterium]|nr:NADH-quinone oxidoreductase subunit A [Pirellulales bacterium]
MNLAILPVLLLVAFLLIVAIGLILLGRIFGPHRAGAVKEMPYESGMDPIHDARRRFDIRFHLVAIAFLVFDVELLFLYPWAVASKSPAGVDQAVVSGLVVGRELVFAGVLFFILLLVLGLIYDWRKGLFRWR